MVKIFDHAIEQGLIETNPAERILRESTRTNKNDERHYPALRTFDELGAVMRAADEANLSRSIYRAHLAVAFTVLRISEAVGARWEEIDLEQAIWTIPRARMKFKSRAAPHDTVTTAVRCVTRNLAQRERVPLSRTEWSAGFAGGRGEGLSRNAEAAGQALAAFLAERLLDARA